jgi:CO/xanthine dehydrogenase Mo-binding subunit
MISKQVSPGDSAATPALTRRAFVKAGGALFVSLVIPRSVNSVAEARATSSDASLLASSWLEIRSDNTILARTGQAEIGTGMSAFFAQMIAEELRVRPEAVTLIMGDTDKTPDGGASAGFLNGAANVRKVAAYTYQALLGLASKKLGIPIAGLSATDSIMSGGGASVSYGELVEGQQLDLRIPVKGRFPKFVEGTNGPTGLDWEGMDGLVVTGDPPMKPMSEFKYIGQSYPMPGTPGKVTGEAQWSCDVKLPGMLHARMVRPSTLGATLVSVGELDKKRFPTAEVVRKGNLLAVVSPDEWEAVKAAQSVAAGTKWTEWAGLPGSENLTKVLREYKWRSAPDQSRGDAAAVMAALVNASKTISATYEQPYVKHAPIGPFLAVADVRSDGSVTVWAQAGHLTASRARIAHLLNTPVEKVAVRWLNHAAQFGRKTFGGDGAEADAVILSQLTGKPVRVQWTLQEDLAWSAASPGWVSDTKAGLDAQGRIVAIHSAFYSPHMSDARPLGAILAGMPSGTPRGGGFLATEWPYDKTPHRFEAVYAMPGLAAESPNGGLRGLIMRTPGQRQQNFVLESLVNEAAACASADPIQFRLDHTTDERLIGLVRATAKAAGWESRPSPHRAARRTGSDPVSGRGMAVMVRANGYWAGIAEVLVTPATGLVRVTNFTIGGECGKIINPRQLDRCMKGGLVMGISEALKEEVTFDSAKVTSTDWSRYKILTMEETPDIKVVQISRDDQGFAAGGEAPNALAPPAIAAAFFDATGVMPRRIPLSPAYVTRLLRS